MRRRAAIGDDAMALQRKRRRLLGLLVGDAEIEELGAIVGRARALKGRGLVVLAELTLGRQDQGDWPDTVAKEAI